MLRIPVILVVAVVTIATLLVVTVAPALVATRSPLVTKAYFGYAYSNNIALY